jgi:inhibitor of KinA sporulation pathway (predicted exonuclease)
MVDDTIERPSTASLRDVNLKLRNHSVEDHNLRRSFLSIYKQKDPDRSPVRIIVTIKDIKNSEKWFKSKMLSVPVRGDVIDIDNHYYEVLKVVRRVSMPNEDKGLACEVGITVFVNSFEISTDNEAA